MHGVPVLRSGSRRHSRRSALDEARTSSIGRRRTRAPREGPDEARRAATTSRAACGENGFDVQAWCVPSGEDRRRRDGQAHRGRADARARAAHGAAGTGVPTSADARRARRRGRRRPARGAAPRRFARRRGSARRSTRAAAAGPGEGARARPLGFRVRPRARGAARAPSARRSTRLASTAARPGSARDRLGAVHRFRRRDPTPTRRVIVELAASRARTARRARAVTALSQRRARGGGRRRSSAPRRKRGC